VIWLTQVLCPTRHCIFGFCWDDRDATAECIEQEAETIFASGVNRWCGIRGSTELRVEHAPAPRFTSLEEAEEILRVVEHQNLASRALLDVLGLSFDEARRRLHARN
jgi:hypothetical protein